MSLQNMLDQMLAAGKDLAAKGESLAQQHLNLPAEGPERDAALEKMGKGAVAAGALALLLGTGAGRKVAGTAAALGGIGALGKVAFDAFQSWKANNAGAPASPGQPVGELTGAAAEQRSAVLFRAMIGAAKADGHIDPAERARIEQAVAHLGLDAGTQAMIEAELASPPDMAKIAAGATDLSSASEIYLASLAVIDPDDPAERAYLTQLAGALKLDPAFASALEAQAQAA